MSGVRQGGQGTSMAGVEVSPARRKRQAARRRAEEARWAAKAGPVEVRRSHDEKSDGPPELDVFG